MRVVRVVDVDVDDVDDVDDLAADMAVEMVVVVDLTTHFVAEGLEVVRPAPDLSDPVLSFSSGSERRDRVGFI